MAPQPDDKTSAQSQDSQLIRELAALLDETSLTEIELERAGLRIRVARNVTIAAAVPSAVPSAAAGIPVAAAASAASAGADLSKHPGVVPSPMVGTAYLSPEPTAAAFVKAGDRVNKGQTVLIIEAKKVMKPILAPTSGVVREILITDGQPVEFGEALMIIQ